MFKYIILLLILFTFLSCSYSVYSGHFPDIKSIKIERFENNTSQFNLDDNLLDVLSKKFLEDGRLKLVNKNPDSVLKGKILKYKNEVYTYKNETVKQYKITMVFKVEFINLNQNKIIWQNDNLELTKIYDFKDSTDLEVSEETARNQIFEDLYQKILSNTIEEW